MAIQQKIFWKSSGRTGEVEQIQYVHPWTWYTRGAWIIGKFSHKTNDSNIIWKSLHKLIKMHL